MTKLSLTVPAVVVAGLALLSTTVAAVASASPDLGPIVNTTCSYPQVMAALNAQDPAAAAQFNASPLAQTALRQFLASPPNQRTSMAQQAANSPGAQQYFVLVQQVIASCNNY